jgi:hypothetical protein
MQVVKVIAIAASQKMGTVGQNVKMWHMYMGKIQRFLAK